MKRWVNTELNNQDWAFLRPFLKSQNIRYEASGCGSGVHIEVYANEFQSALCTAIMKDTSKQNQLLSYIIKLKLKNFINHAANIMMMLI